MLGARIGVLRRGAGLSQSELAQRLQISPSAVGMYEQGRREPSAELLIALAEQFGVSVDYLLTGKATLPQEQETAERTLHRCVGEFSRLGETGQGRRFSRQELVVLFAALLMES